MYYILLYLCNYTTEKQYMCHLVSIYSKKPQKTN